MDSVEDIRLALINPIELGSLSSAKEIESRNVTVSPSTMTITMTSNVSDNDELHSTYFKKRQADEKILLANIGCRLALRKDLQNRLCFISDIMCFLALFGIILMIIENEITFIQIDHKDTILTWFIKLMITISTIVLIGFIFYYHHLDSILYSVNNSLDNWRIAITNTKIILILSEIFICSIRPIPRSFPYHLNPSLENISSNSSTSTSYSLSYIAVDVALGLPMFARLYLLCRFIIFHSHLIRDTSLQSLGYFNQVSINFFFLIKTYLEQWPIRSLIVFCTFIFFIGSWCLRACNYLPTAQHLSMLDSMWLFIVTFTTVGYGDLTPSTYCGRNANKTYTLPYLLGIAAIIGLVGVFSTALVIAVLAKRLVLDRWEKYVHNFVLNAELAKERKIQAVNIIKCTLKVWYLKNKKRPRSSIQYLQAQRKLFQSIHSVQQIKQEQRKLIDNCVGLIDLHTVQRNSTVTIDETAQQMKIMKVKIDRIEEKLVNMNNTMDDIQKTLNILLNKATK